MPVLKRRSSEEIVAAFRTMVQMGTSSAPVPSRTPLPELPDSALIRPRAGIQHAENQAVRTRRAAGLFEACANPGCGSGWMHLLRSIFTVVEHVPLPDGNEWHLAKPLASPSPA